jgi:Amt family ammonium transporter
MQINAGDTAWVMVSAALVMLMTPGLALFYGGMVRAKSVLNMIMMSFLALGIVTLIWLTYGYSLAFGTDMGFGLLGGLEYLGLRGAIDQATGPEGNQIPLLVFVMFQMTFAVITCALLSGAVADRIRTRAWVALVIAWTTLVYIPIAHWAFAFQDGSGGWIGDRLGALDFAGGTAVEINSGFSALALALVVGARLGFRRDPMRPHNLPLVLLGAGLLWFGWFGFNAGSALSAGQLAGTAMINTQIATAAASLSWVIVERLRDGKATTLGIASGAISGAVAITPSCGFVTPMGALAIGLAAGGICAMAVSVKYRLGYDDSLDVLGVHGIGGIVGMLSIGFLATTAVNGAGADGLFAGGGWELLGKQALAASATMVYAFGVTWLIAKAIDRVIGFRIAPDAEVAGIDLAEHAESAYELTDSSGGAFAGVGTAGLSHYIQQARDNERSEEQ